jgi:hypothetical protein
VFIVVILHPFERAAHRLVDRHMAIRVETRRCCGGTRVHCSSVSSAVKTF